MMPVPEKLLSQCGWKRKYRGKNMGKRIVRVPIESSYEYRWSVDGNRYGEPYDVTIPAGFGDKLLENDGWEEVIVANGSTFYSWNGMHFAEGLEKSRGINNQDLTMGAVSTFKDTMAIGFGYDGSMVFDLQRNIESQLDCFYGAVTSAFGIMKDDYRNEAGKELSASRRNRIYENISGRTIVGFDANANAYVVISVTGTTGKSGMYGRDLFAMCESEGMTDAVCFDGGGSVFLREYGKVVHNTTRKVKNAIILYRRKKSTPTPEPEPTGGFLLNVASVGMYVRETLEFNVNKKPCGKILAMVRIGEKAEVIEFVDGIQADGYQWLKVKFDDIIGYSQYDSRCYWLKD